MSNKEYVKLGDICDVRDGTHDSPKQVAIGKPLVTSRHIKYGRIELDDTYNIAITDFNAINIRSKVDRFDILFTMIGTVAETALVEIEPDFAIKNIGLIKTGGNREFAKWIYYYLKSPEAKAEIDASLKGSTQSYISLGDLRNFPIKIPPLSERQSIVSVLSSLDDKIDLLHRQNKTLEAMAETLFRQWFVEEAEDDWEEITLKDFVKCITGYSYKSINLQPSHETALVNLKNFSRDGSFNLAGLKEYTGPYKESQLVSKGDLIVAHTDITQNADIIGQPALMIDTGKYKNLVISTDLVKVVPTTDLLDTYFLYYLFKSPDFKGYAVGISNGTTVIHLSKKAIPDYSFSIPNFNIVRDFSEKVRANLIMINDNNSQISKLRIIRDLLLPKLMSGEVRVEF